MLLAPGPVAVASPLEPAALLIVAMFVLEELQVANVVKSCVELSEYIPRAVNCCVLPFAIEGVTGVTVIDVSVAAVTVSVVDFETLPSIAWITVDPTAAEVPRPFDPAALLTVATFVLEEVHVTEAVRSCVEPSV